MSVCLERLLYVSDEDTVRDIVKELGAMDSKVKEQFEAYVWDYINGNRGVQDEIFIKLF